MDDQVQQGLVHQVLVHQDIHHDHLVLLAQVMDAVLLHHLVGMLAVHHLSEEAHEVVHLDARK